MNDRLCRLFVRLAPRHTHPYPHSIHQHADGVGDGAGAGRIRQLTQFVHQIAVHARVLDADQAVEAPRKGGLCAVGDPVLGARGDIDVFAEIGVDDDVEALLRRAALAQPVRYIFRNHAVAEAHGRFEKLVLVGIIMVQQPARHAEALRHLGEGQTVEAFFRQDIEGRPLHVPPANVANARLHCNTAMALPLLRRRHQGAVSHGKRPVVKLLTNDLAECQ